MSCRPFPNAECMEFITLWESRNETNCLSSEEDSLFFLASLGSQDWFYISQCFEGHSLSISLGKDEPYVRALT